MNGAPACRSGAPPGDGTAPGRRRGPGARTSVELAADDEQTLALDEQRELGQLLAGRRPIHQATRTELQFRRWQRGMHRRNVPADADHQRWRDSHDLTMARAGSAPPWQLARARELWRERVR
jgi:hypothetical protein